MNAGRHVMSWADRREPRTGRQSVAAQAFGRFLGD
jgi:hypothetical protein